ncbi:MAG: hypothetical protein A3K19_13660 [Lentisphaerae bacterium RIFOXYB12_FULL_65_16]|nr:MAG: hypothetical protein A3K18_17695 [Lentisphaerae bacterium RIFOXYA12_64_32]OGV94172.1 MAG: hypothetical protein A3K19_13660 [Lentisphaerae bacterium RIFOXYB12_FULL_65_16]
MTPAPDFTLTVDRQPVFLYRGSVYYPPYLELKKVPFGAFDFTGEVTVRLESKTEIRTVDIRPRSLGITATHDAHSVSFRLRNPAQLSVEINGSLDHAVLVFANPIETEVPRTTDENILYFGPGVHEAGIINLGSGQTLYLAGGAYVNGIVRTDHADNIRILGRGILNGGKMPREAGICVRIDGGRKIRLEGIIILDPPSWTVRIMGCDDVDIRNLKIIGWRGNSDGIDVCGSRDVTVKNCFIRNWDDGLAVKAFNTGDARNIHFSHCTLWNDFARPIEVGYENQADHISQIVFEDIDIIHALSGYPMMGIHQGDRAIISHIRFENIRIEDAPNAQLFDFRIKPSAWNKDPKPGRIHTIAFKSIFLNGKPGIDRLPEDSRMEGFSAESTIEDVTFESVHILGKKVLSAADCNLNCNGFTKNIRFIDRTGDEENPGCVPVESRLEIAKPFQMAKDGFYYGTIGVMAKNLSRADIAEGYLEMDISPDTDLRFITDNRLTYVLNPGEVIEKDFDIAILPGKYFFTTQSNVVGLRRSWQVIELPWLVERHPMSAPTVIRQAISQAAAREITHFDGHKAGTVSLMVMGDQLILKADICETDMSGPGTGPAPRSGSVERESVAFTKGAFMGKRFMVENEPYGTSAIELFAAMPARPLPGEAAFILPETAIGRTTAVIHGEQGFVLAPELRNILEITYVFKNQPKVEKISHIVIEPGSGPSAKAWSVAQTGRVDLDQGSFETCRTATGYSLLAIVPFAVLGVRNTAPEFWLEIMVSTVLPGEPSRRAITVFHSLKPEESAQMFGRIRIRPCAETAP